MLLARAPRARRGLPIVKQIFSEGHCLCSGSVHYLTQQVNLPEDTTLGDLAGVQATLDALARIESGSTAPEDFEAVGDRWDIRRLRVTVVSSGWANRRLCPFMVTSCSGNRR